MKKLLLQGFCAVLVLISFVIYPGMGEAQVERSRLFEKTGHWVTGKFLDFYEQIPNGEEIYGDPITDAFDSTLSRNPSGTLIQYFERARFELHPDNPSELKVTLTLIGEYLYSQDEIDPSTKIPIQTTACKSFPPDSFPVCNAFLDYYNHHGGIAQFGYPLSHFILYEGRMIQYFQRARFVWCQECPDGMRVSLGNIGWEYFNAINENPLFLQHASDFIPENLVELRVHAFVSRAVIPPDGMQEIFVVVQNQLLQPVSGVHVSLQIIFPSGNTLNYSMQLTDSHGLSRLPIAVHDEPTGWVQVIVKARTSISYVSTETSFRIWK